MNEYELQKMQEDAAKQQIQILHRVFSNVEYAILQKLDLIIKLLGEK